MSGKFSKEVTFVLSFATPYREAREHFITLNFNIIKIQHFISISVSFIFGTECMRNPNWMSKLFPWAVASRMNSSKRTGPMRLSWVRIPFPRRWTQFGWTWTTSAFSGAINSFGNPLIREIYYCRTKGIIEQFLYRWINFLYSSQTSRLLFDYATNPSDFEKHMLRHYGIGQPEAMTARNESEAAENISVEVRS